FVPDAGYLQALRALCDEHQWLLMLAEVQTGNGRTGTFFNYQRHGILPDVVTTAKGLANGFPLGACLASGVAATLMKPGNHGSTFGGNPVACAAALATLNTLDGENLAARAADLGERLRADLARALEGCAAVRRRRRGGGAPVAAAHPRRWRGRRAGGLAGTADPRLRQHLSAATLNFQ